MASSSSEELVRQFLRGQNLEQLGRIDDAIAVYESVVAESFDASGPYDRLLMIYTERGRHTDVIRVARLALTSIHTHEGKRGWYQGQITRAEKASASTPEPL